MRRRTSRRRRYRHSPECHRGAAPQASTRRSDRARRESPRPSRMCDFMLLRGHGCVPPRSARCSVYILGDARPNLGCRLCRPQSSETDLDRHTRAGWPDVVASDPGGRPRDRMRASAVATGDVSGALPCRIGSPSQIMTSTELKQMQRGGLFRGTARRCWSIWLHPFVGSASQLAATWDKQVQWH